ncbi:MAG: hypothetical protein QOH59_2288 [Gemmatimonadales bacterium]|nr:hypothetical protein [Gemmatimonadales bacterium]
MNLLPDPQKENPPAVRYAFAVAAAAAAVILGLLLRPLIHPSVLAPFLLAVAISALYGGIGPAVVTSLLCVAALDYWFLRPGHTLSVAASAGTARVLIFLVMAAFITWLAVTIRKQRSKEVHMNGALRASEDRFRLASEALAAFLYEWEPVTNRVRWFGGLEVVVGFGLDEVRTDGEWWVSRIHPGDVDRVVQLGRSALESDAASYSMAYRVLHRDGHYVTVGDRFRIVRDETGRPIRVLGGVSDISERMRVEDALHVSEERFRLTSEALAAFLYEWDPITNQLECFGGMEEVLGFRLDEVKPDLAWYESRMHPDDMAPAWESLQAALNSGLRGCTMVYRFRHWDGHYVHLADRSRIVRDEAGRPIRVLGGVSDISERVRLEAERAELLLRERGARAAAEDAVRHRDDVLAVVSHDLRNPLATISICASAIAQNMVLASESVLRLLASIKHTADSAERLIRDLMDVASIEAGRLAVEPHAEAPADMLEQAADMFAAMASARGVLLETRTTPGLPPVRADAERVLQGLANLVSNSLRFTESGGHITLWAEPDPVGVRFAVEDTGSGIAPEDLPHVFDRFWQRQHRAGVGSGLGLSIVRGIVDAHGGQVMAESTPGKGSRFSFTLLTAD